MLEALREFWSVAEDVDSAVKDALRRGHDYFLRRRRDRSETTGDVFNASFTRFSFPRRWYVDVLRVLDHLQAVDHDADNRFADAIELLLRQRRTSGRWHAQKTHSGRIFFVVEKAGRDSRFNTLRALRVLRWARRRDLVDNGER